MKRGPCCTCGRPGTRTSITRQRLWPSGKMAEWHVDYCEDHWPHGTEKGADPAKDPPPGD